MASAMVVPKTLQAYTMGSAIFGEFGDPWEVTAGLNWWLFRRATDALGAGLAAKPGLSFLLCGLAYHSFDVFKQEADLPSGDEAVRRFSRRARTSGRAA
jgi:hypothetical protein